MQLFYAAQLEENTKEYLFDKEESRHINKVLRKTIGDSLHITNGKGWLFDAEITASDLRHCAVTITKAHFTPARKGQLHMAVAPTKMNDRYEWFLEKATEIGIEKITPIICDHSERKIIKTERFEKILQSAAKQSLNPYLPVLETAISFKDFLKGLNKDEKKNLLIAHCEPREKALLQHRIEPGEDSLILIGPEGDFSTSEIKAAMDLGFTPISLGESRLRTETAAIVACHTHALVNQGL